MAAGEKRQRWGPTRTASAPHAERLSVLIRIASATRGQVSGCHSLCVLEPNNEPAALLPCSRLRSIGPWGSPGVRLSADPLRLLLPPADVQSRHRRPPQVPPGRARLRTMAALDFKPGRISLDDYEQRRQACTADALAR